MSHITDSGPQESSSGRPPSAARRVLRMALLAAGAYLLVVILIMFLERTIMYPAPPVSWGDWQPAGLNHQDVYFHSADGTRLHGWYVPHPGGKRAVLFMHGNGEHVGVNADTAAEIRDQLDAAVLLFDYRGYGHSEGNPAEAGLIADGLAAQRWLAEKEGIRPEQIVLFGRSLGTGVAVALASQQGASALVLDSGFSSMVDVAASHFRWLPVRRLLKDRYESLLRIAKYDGPVYQLHGTRDEVIPFELGRRLYDAVPSRHKHFEEIPGMTHNEPRPAGYLRRVAAFLDGLEADELRQDLAAGGE